jgi:hypothetical protein
VEKERGGAMKKKRKRQTDAPAIVGMSAASKAFQQLVRHVSSQAHQSVICQQLVQHVSSEGMSAVRHINQ